MLRVEGPWFRDELGGYVLLRGVCVGSSAKTPAHPAGATHLAGSLEGNPRDVSFVGRPFPLAEADEHFARIRAFGFNAIRLIATWEAIEHAGPGRYDEAYLDYLGALAARAEAAGLWVVLDLHQDVWSRWSGGDGAPAWVFDAIGLDVRAFDEAEAAITMQRRGAAYRYLEWPNNYNRYACATLFTLFFGGDTFAPRTQVDGAPVQRFLQTHYLGALTAAAARLRGLRRVAGVDVMNEPSFGYIGLRDLAVDTLVPLDGPRASAFDSMLLASGWPRPAWERIAGGILPAGWRVLNPRGRRAFIEGAECPWRAHGVWDVRHGKPVLLRPDYFHHVQGAPINRFRAFLLPLLQQAARALASALPDVPLFVESDPQGVAEVSIGPGELSRAVNAHHWYDAVTLYTRRYQQLVSFDIYARRPVAGAANVRRMLRNQLAWLRRLSEERMGGCPTVLGEFGVPFDLDGAQAYRTGIYTEQTRALSDYYGLLDELLLHGFLWNYAADNTHRTGDGWNREDLSIYSADDRALGRGDGGRAVHGFSRPYVRRATGPLRAMRFDPIARRFHATFDPEEGVRGATEVVVPKVQYPRGYAVRVTGGRFESREAGALLEVFAAGGAPCTVELLPHP